MSLNTFTISGRLARDCELRQTTSGHTIASFTLAHNYKTKRGGEQKEETLWITCQAWESLALLISKYTRKGSLVVVQGRMRQEEWQDKDGKTQRSMSLVVSDIQLPEKEKGSTQIAQPQEDDREDIPF